MVFSPSAEQLRWDAYRTGHLAAADWPRVRAQVEPVLPPGNGSGSEFAFALTLLGGATPVRRIIRPGQLQSVQMALDAEPALGGQITAATLYWGRRDPLPVPLAPMALPATRDNGWTPRRELMPVRLVVGGAVRSRLAEVCARSLDVGTELGGALVGRFVSPDELVVEAAPAAGDEGGSASAFRFDSRFWTQFAACGTDPGRRVVGWFHSHLCDRGHPSDLSTLDLHIMHRHFASPWLVTALVCASARQSQVRWYHWQEGAVVERQDPDSGSHIPGPKEGGLSS